MSFFLSKYWLEFILNNPFSENENLSSTALVKVEKLDIVRSSSDVDNSSSICDVKCVLTDSSTKSNCTVDKTLWSYCTQSNVESIDEPASYLFENAIILIISYSLNKLPDGTNSLVLKKFQTVGYMSQSNNNTNKKRIYQTNCTHRISDLRPNDSNKNVSIECILMDISEAKKFSHKSDMDGIVQRLLLRDSSGQTEMVIFGESTQRSDVQKLKRLKVYRIQNFGIKTAVTRFRIWSNEFQITYDLHLNEFTKFEELDIDPNQLATLKRTNDTNDDDDDDDDEHHSYKANKNSIEPMVKKTKSSQLDFVPLAYLISLRIGSYVNVLACIIRSDEQTTQIKLKSCTISKRIIDIVDSSNKIVCLTLWGKEAQDYKQCDKGSIVMLKEVRLTNYNGVSLTKDRKTVMVILDCEQANHSFMQEIQDLKNWWNFNKEKY